MTSRAHPADRSRRRFIALAGIFALGLAGCVGRDDGFQLDPDDFDDASLHLVAEGVARTELDLVEIGRAADGWIEVSVSTDIDLQRHTFDLPWGTPVPDEPIPPEWLAPPGAVEIVDGYIDAVEAGESAEGLRVGYDDGRCTGRFSLRRSRVDWFLAGDIERGSVHVVARESYRIDCPE